MKATPATQQPADDFPASPSQGLLAAEQARLLAEIATAATHAGQQIVRQAEAAQWLDAERALLFARVTRAVRQTIGMERSLGAHDDPLSERQKAKLYALMTAGGALIRRLGEQNRDPGFLDGPGALMMLRLDAATKRTMALLRRIDGECALAPAQRSAAWKRRMARRQSVRSLPLASPVGLPAQPVDVSAEVSFGMAATLLDESLDDIRGDAKGAGRNDRAVDVDADAPDEDLSVLDVQAEIGGRSVAEIAAAACKLIGITPAPALVGDVVSEAVKRAVAPRSKSARAGWASGAVLPLAGAALSAGFDPAARPRRSVRGPPPSG